MNHRPNRSVGGVQTQDVSLGSRCSALRVIGWTHCLVKQSRHQWPLSRSVTPRPGLVMPATKSDQLESGLELLQSLNQKVPKTLR